MAAAFNQHACCLSGHSAVCPGFSAQSVFFPLYIATFNALWAAYPTLGYGLFEQVNKLQLFCVAMHVM